MKRGRKPFTLEQLQEILADLERIPSKSKKDLAKIGCLRRRLGIYIYGRGQSNIKVSNYIRKQQEDPWKSSPSR